MLNIPNNKVFIKNKKIVIFFVELNFSDLILRYFNIVKHLLIKIRCQVIS